MKRVLARQDVTPRLRLVRAEQREPLERPPSGRSYAGAIVLGCIIAGAFLALFARGCS